jgi:TP901 family phage tail tape measure protein
MAEVVLIEFVGDAKSGVAAANEQVAANDRVAASAKSASKASVAGAGASTASWKKNAATASMVGRSMTKWVSLPLIGIGVAATKMSLDFGRSMSLISTQAGGSAKEVAKLKGEVLKLAENSKFGPNELAEGLYHVESAGFRGAKAMKVLNEAQKLATVGNSNMEQTTYALVSALQTGIKGTKDMGEAAGLMNAIVGHGDMRMEEFTASLSSGILPAAKNVGLSLRDVGAALDVMTARGQPAQMSATRLRMTFALMSATTEKAQKALATVGIGSETLANTMRSKGLVPAIKLLSEHLESISKTKANRVLVEAFGGGKTSSTIETLVQNVGDLGKRWTEIGKSVGEYSKNVREAEHTPKVELEKEWSKLKVSLIEVGDELTKTLVPVFKEVLGDVSTAFKGFAALPDPIKKLGVEFGIALVAFGPLLSGASKLYSLYKLIAATSIVSGAGGVAAEAGAVGSGSTFAVTTGGAAAGGSEAAAGGGLASAGAAAVAANPEILAAVAATAALSVALVELYKHSKAFREEVGELGAALSHVFGEMKAEIHPLVQAFAHLGHAFSSAPIIKELDQIHGPVGSVVHLFHSDLVQSIRGAFKEAAAQVEGFGKVFAGSAHIIKAIVNTIADVMEGKFGKAWHDIEDLFGGAVKVVIGEVQAGTAPLRLAAETYAKVMNSIFGGMWKDIGNIFKGGINDVIGLVNDMIGLIDELPFVHVGTIGTLGSGPSFTGHKAAKAAVHHQHRARGGAIFEGEASGDSVPAMLERGEYVLNRKAVARIGRGQLDRLNFAEAPRFAFGGAVGEAAESVAGTVAGAARGLAGDAAGLGLGALPNPGSVLPHWLSGLGGYLEHEAVSWVKGQKKKFGGIKGGGPGGPVPPGGPRRWLTEALKLTGHFSQSNLSGLYRQMMSESGGNPHAINLTDSNAAAGHPSKGLLQTIDSTFNAYKMKGHGNIWNPVDNAIAAIRYMFARYGHIVSTGEGYAEGGAVGEGIQRLAAGGSPKLGNPSKIRLLSSEHGPADAAHVVAWAKHHLGSSDKWGYPGEWCGAFMGADMLAHGISPPSGYPLASAWGSWGKSGGAALGNVVVIGGSGHVGLSLGGGRMISGNFSNTVAESSIAEAAGGRPVTGYRVPPYSGAPGPSGTGPPAMKVPKLPATVPFHQKVATIAPGGYANWAGRVSLAKLTFPPLPTTLGAVRHELSERRSQQAEYRAALHSVKRKDEKDAIRANLKLLRERVAELLKVQSKLLRERLIAKKILPRGTFPDAERHIADRETAYEVAAQYAEQVAALEPEEASGSTLAAYIEGKESPALGAVLGSENAWRNTIIGAEGTAESHISGLAAQIANIVALRKSNPKAFQKQKWRLPPLREALSSARESFDPRTNSGSFAEALANVQGVGGNRTPLSELPSTPEAGAFGGVIWDTQMAIRELGLKIKSALVPEENTALLEATKQLAETANKEKRLAELQYGPLAEFLKAMPPYIGAFKSGTNGPIPGGVNQAYTATVHGGETIVPAGGSQPMHLHLHGDIASMIDIAAPGLAREVDQRMGAKYRHIKFGPGR